MEQEILDKMAREQRMSPFERYLRTLPVAVCEIFRSGGSIAATAFQPSGQTLCTRDAAEIEALFPQTIKSHNNQVLNAIKASGAPAVCGKKVLVLFSGGPAAGGNNVIVGLFKALGSQNKLFGVKAGPGGLLKGDTFEITEENARLILNMGGFDFLGSDRTKIEDLG
jgi:diphosphate-dependent phosphofructokinase